MKHFLSILILACCMISCSDKGPEFQFSEIKRPYGEHLRGISVVNENIIWASGTHGKVLKSLDGGMTWKQIPIPGAEELDLRDIHAFDENTAITITAGTPGRIYRTDDGGGVWYVLFNNTSPDIFMDGMDFESKEKGMLFGDPFSGLLFVMRTSNGTGWQRVGSKALIPLEGEAGYAASGSGLVLRGDKAWFATGGGPYCRLFKTEDFGDNWKSTPIPLRSASGAGVFSMAFSDDLMGIAVGGDYVDSTRNDSNAAITIDGGETWELLPKGALNGYRSCVATAEWNKQPVYISSGRTGGEFSLDGYSWVPLQKEGFYAMDFTGSIGWMVGRGGKMMKVTIK